MGSFDNAEQRAPTGTEAVCGEDLRKMHGDEPETGTASQERRPLGQSTGEYRNPLHEMSSGTSPARPDQGGVRDLQNDIRAKGSSQSKKSQVLFCRVCEGVGPHLCREKVARSRVKMLRGAGNAIVPQVAAAFIKAAT
jgi:hypothetical protein